MKMRETKEASSEGARIEVQKAPKVVESGEEACLLPPLISSPSGIWDRTPKRFRRIDHRRF